MDFKTNSCAISTIETAKSYKLPSPGLTPNPLSKGRGELRRGTQIGLGNSR